MLLDTFCAFLTKCRFVRWRKNHNWSFGQTILDNILDWTRSPSLGACSYPIFLSRRFHRTIYFWFEFMSNSDPHRNLSDQLQSLARTNVDMSTWYRQVHVRLHCFILAEACSCRLELGYFAGKLSKNRPVCKNAVALAYNRSCRLLVMGSWLPITKPKKWTSGSRDRGALYWDNF